MVQKTSTSKSRSKSVKTSTGKKVTRSSGRSKTTTASSLEKNLKTLTSTKQQKRTGTSSGTKARAKVADRGVKHTRCKDTSLFPCDNMPWRLEPRTDKFNLSWYMCFDHAVDQIERSNLKPRDYKLMCHTNVPISDPLTGGVRTQRYVRGS